MRRPPEDVSERDVHSSNATLNTVFGGARQKSWMTGGLHGPPVRPTPRTSTSKTAGPQVEIAQRPSANSPLRSFEPTPLPAHTSTINNSRMSSISRAPNDENRRSTPLAVQTPTTRMTTEPSRVTEALLASPRPAPQATPLAQATNSSSYAQARGTSSNEIRDSMSPTSLPRISMPAVPSSGAPPADYVPASYPNISSTLPQSHSRPTSQRPSSGQALVSSIHVPLQTAEQATLQKPSGHQGPGTKTNSISTHAASSNLPSTVTQNQFQQARNNGSAHPSPAKRQRTQEPVMPSLKPRIALIDAHIASIGGNQNLNNVLERPRFQLLTDACSINDAFYVVLHQVFTVWDSNRNEVLDIGYFPTGNTLLLAFKILGQLIRDNEGLAPANLKWFAQFPSPLRDLLRTSEPYRRVMTQVGEFLNNLTTHWADMSRTCTARGYPPLVDEMVNILGLQSPTLRQVVFTATRRNLGVQDDKFGQEMELIFLQDQKDHVELSKRYHTDRPPSEKEVDRRNQELIDSYLAVYNPMFRKKRQLVSGLAAGSPLAQPPIVPANGNLATATSLSNNAPSFDRSSVDLNPPSRHNNNNNNNNVQSPDLPGPWNQPSQPTRTPSSGSINPSHLANAGRTSSIAGQRPYENTPSPTIIQNSSVNSPSTYSPQQALQWPPPPIRSNSVPGIPGRDLPSMNQIGMVNQHPAQPDHIVPNGEQNQHVQMHQQQQMAMQQPRQHSGQPQPTSPYNAAFVPTPQQMGQQHQHQAQRQQQALYYQQQHQQAMQQQAAIQMQALQIQQQRITAPQHRQTMTQEQFQAASQRQSAAQQSSPAPRGLSAEQHQQQQIAQQQIAQQQAALQQQVLGMNRAAQLRPGPQQQQRSHSRNNSISSNGRPTPHPVAGQAPVSPGFTLEQINQMEVHYYHQKVSDQDVAQRVDRTLVPPLNYIYPAQPVNPELDALHQAHVRSPRLVSVDHDSHDGTGEDPSRRFYQAVKEFALQPTKLPVNVGKSRFTFNVPKLAQALIARDVRQTTDKLANREFARGTLQYRLRCIQTGKHVTSCRMSDWVISDTVWPESVFIEINGCHLEIRRKTHHGKDLPIDITRYIAPPNPDNGGTSINTIYISVPRLPKQQKECWYFLAVEVIEILQHTQILSMVHLNRIPASETLAQIRKSMAATDDDDDFAVVVSDLSVDLADPFTARIFTVPVRGNSCLHRECFDLETFLLTRNSKPKHPGQPSMIDVWKCPLCGKDARPYSLQIIDFLADVRKLLEMQEDLDVKAILISADGTWRPKSEPQPLKRKASDGLDDQDTSDDDMGLGSLPRKENALAKAPRQSSAQLNEDGRRQSSAASRGPIEVIDLDD